MVLGVDEHGESLANEQQEDILDGIVDVVFSEIELPPAAADWRSALRHRALSARTVLRRHTWAAPLMESRRNGNEVEFGLDVILDGLDRLLRSD